ncbi:hypothetical protein FHS31_002088 [Sphingomonas vulcanisoli]|uniref:Uncharacterized protein n=1 Tax=Sphingomonas vulcanisoli TaxID=1658060 RepID=A0ABX0TXV1_9SPHN|nr:hypothetical protein [Sphingomonas vulcanisoli]NIJ08471.1 hypothetical protein [Sphingomonas vulcanisoli]
MFRPLLIAASLFSVAAPALAEAPISATPGALAGRSPHHQFIAADADRSTCGKTMHSLPAGKPHAYGRHALAAQPCAQSTLAATPAQTEIAAN